MNLANSCQAQRVRHDARHAVYAIIPLVAVLFSACTSQKGTEWDALNTQMLGQFNSASYDACLDTGAKALAVAKAENDPRQHDVISTLNLSAICHQNKRELAQARTLLEEARARHRRQGRRRSAARLRGQDVQQPRHARMGGGGASRKPKCY